MEVMKNDSKLLMRDMIGYGKFNSKQYIQV